MRRLMIAGNTTQLWGHAIIEADHHKQWGKHSKENKDRQDENDAVTPVPSGEKSLNYFAVTRAAGFGVLCIAILFAGFMPAGTTSEKGFLRDTALAEGKSEIKHFDPAKSPVSDELV